MDRVDELVAFLQARLDEDEQVALAAAHGVSGRWLHRRGGVEFGDGPDDWPDWSSSGVVVHDEGEPTAEQAEHIALHDPARVLRKVHADRMMIAFALTLLGPIPTPAGYPEAARAIKLEVELAEEKAAGVILRLLALGYSDRPGFKDEWRPA